MTHHLSAALAALLLITASTAAEETHFLVLAVESTGAEFKQAVAHAAPQLAEHITLPQEIPDPAKLQSWRVCDLKFAEAIATVAKLQTKELSAENSPISITPLAPDPGRISISVSCRVSGGPLVPSANGFRPENVMCLAFAAPDRADGYRVYLIIPQ
jgi:hypothetical protein